MRKRIVNLIFDNILWYMVYLFPIILTFILARPTESGGIDYTIWNSVFSSIGIDSSNFICQLLSNIGNYFDTNIFEVGTFLNCYCSYFLIATIIHLGFDILAFIPRFGHSLIGGLYNNETLFK